MRSNEYGYVFRVAEAMERFGGSFARAIAEAWFRADESNRRKLENCFNELFVEYEKFLD